MTDIAEATTQYARARLERDHTAAKLKEANKAFMKAEAELRETMTEMNEFGYKIKLAGHPLNIVRKKSCRVSCTIANTSKWIDWLRERGEEIDDYVRRQIITGNLRSVVREVIDAEGLFVFGDLEDCIDTTDAIAVTGWSNFLEAHKP